MPADLRAELTSLRAAHGELVRKYDTISKEHAQLKRQRRAFAGQVIKSARRLPGDVPSFALVTATLTMHVRDALATRD